MHSAWTGSLHVLQLKQTGQIWKLCFRHSFLALLGIRLCHLRAFHTQTNTPPEVNGGLEDFREGNLSGAILNFGGACCFIHIQSCWNAQVEQDDIPIKLAENISQTLHGCESKGAYAAYCLMSLRAFVTELPKGIHLEPRQTGAEWGRSSDFLETRCIVMFSAFKTPCITSGGPSWKSNFVVFVTRASNVWNVEASHFKQHPQFVGGA